MVHANNPPMFRLFLAALTLLVFTVAAAAMIVAWISAVPEAYAVDLVQAQSLTPYIGCINPGTTAPLYTIRWPWLTVPNKN